MKLKKLFLLINFYSFLTVLFVSLSKPKPIKLKCFIARPKLAKPTPIIIFFGSLITAWNDLNEVIKTK